MGSLSVRVVRVSDDLVGVVVSGGDERFESDVLVSEEVPEGGGREGGRHVRFGRIGRGG